ncbi:hypothetical protein BJ508DRAFT_359496 [Ascobolus immersus RN42]|uniref:C2H2-type domain-containing protein n=1 Tax=Ascobolus immersus RN42 TaxID=1160509 RepID=A0A3N4IGN5_ASCIM|nr:hypothetical protein BJ508DRAFT_359496 [Ascobolus immersus RN42]
MTRSIPLSKQSHASASHNTAITNFTSNPTPGPQCSSFEPSTFARQIQEWIAMANERHGRLSGNASLYLYQARDKTSGFLQRNIDRVLAHNEHLRNGAPPGQTTKRRRLTKINEIYEKLLYTWEESESAPLLQIEFPDLRVQLCEPHNDISHFTISTPYTGPFKCRAELVLYHNIRSISQEIRSEEVKRLETTCKMTIDPGNPHFVRLKLEEPFRLDARDFLVRGTADPNVYVFGDMFRAVVSFTPLTKNAVWPPLVKKSEGTGMPKDATPNGGTGPYTLDSVTIPVSVSKSRRQTRQEPTKTRTTREIKTAYGIGHPPEWETPATLQAIIEDLPRCPQRGTKLPTYFLDKGTQWYGFGDKELRLTIKAGWNQSFEVYKPMVMQRFQKAHDSLRGIRKERARSRTDGVCRVRYCFRDVDNDGDVRSDEFEPAEDGFPCCNCHLRFRSPESLCFHLVASHGRFSFEFTKSDEKDGPKLEVGVDLSRTSTDPYGERKREERELWIRPKGPFDLDQFIDGRWGWGALPPDVQHFIDGSWNWEPTPQATPEVENMDTVTAPEEEDWRAALSQTKVVPFDPKAVKILPPRHKRMSKVPKAYHKWDSRVFVRSKTKRFLEEGEVVSESDDDVDEEWLKDAHDSVIDDFTDVSISEKRLIKLWDRHIFEERPAAARFMPAVLVRFVRKHREQIAETELLVEFWKLGLSLIQCNSIDASCLTECMKMLKGEHGWSSFGKSKFGIGLGVTDPNERPMPGDYALEDWELVDQTTLLTIRENNEKRVEKPREDNFGPCICGEPWTKFGMVACDGEDCAKRMFHMDCMFPKGHERPDHFLCPDCKQKAPPSSSSSSSAPAPAPAPAPSPHFSLRPRGRR